MRWKPDHFKAVLKPDAILEAKFVRRRLFLEAETGTQSIASAHPGRSGAIVSKVRRYLRFVGGLRPDTRRTYYSAAFDDTLQPRVVFLVHSAERKGRVESALKEEFRDGFAHDFGVFVLTFDEAPAALASYLLGRGLKSTPVIEKPRTLRSTRRGPRCCERASARSSAPCGRARGRPTRCRSSPTADSLRALRTLNDFVVQDLGGQQIE